MGNTGDVAYAPNNGGRRGDARATLSATGRHHFPEAFEALGRWQREGKLVQKEDVAVGLENASRGLMRLSTGENFGKQLLRIADQPLP